MQPSVSFTHRTMDAKLEYYNFPDGEDKIVFKTNSTPQLVLTLEKIDRICPGMTVGIEHSFECESYRYEHLPSSCYQVLTFTNVWPQTQKLYTYWSDNPTKIYTHKIIKIYIPSDKSQLPQVMAGLM